MKRFVSLTWLVVLAACSTPARKPAPAPVPRSEPPLPPMPMQMAFPPNAARIEAPTAPPSGRVPSSFTVTQLDTNGTTATLLYPVSRMDWTVEGKPPWSEWRFPLFVPTPGTPRGDDWTLEWSNDAGLTWTVYNDRTNRVSGQPVALHTTTNTLGSLWRIHLLGPD